MATTDTYLMWLIWKVSDLQKQLSEYIDRNKNKSYTGNQVFIAMKTQYETLDFKDYQKTWSLNSEALE